MSINDAVNDAARAAQQASWRAAFDVAIALQQQAAHRRNYVEHLDEQSVRNGGVEGEVEISDQGESMVEIFFPIEFLEKPNFGHGLELAPNQSPERGRFPLYGATVFSWKTKRGTNGRITWVGAQVGVSVLAINGLKMILHYSFRGQSFTNPSSSTASVTGTL